MKIEDAVNGKLIIISRPLDTRPKVVHLFYFMLLLSIGVILLRFVIESEGNLSAIIVGGLLMLIVLVGAHRFANRAIMSERLLITRESLVLYQKGIFKSSKQVFDTQKIYSFRHLAKQPLSPHYLAGETFDYLGFQGRQQIINDMYGDNQLAFDYDGKVIKFGNNIPSWDWEELEIILFDVTGRDLREAKKEDMY